MTPKTMVLRVGYWWPNR